jgi:hypothetical protein
MPRIAPFNQFTPTRGRSASLKEFQAEIRKNGVQHLNRFVVSIAPPLTLKVVNPKTLKLRCFASELPGKQLMTKNDILRYGRGPVETIPYGTQFSPVPLSFILDDKGLVLQMFHQWFTSINDSDSSKGVRGKYDVAYKDEYAADVMIDQQDVTGKRTFQCSLFKAFPLSLGSVSVAWDQNNSIAVLPVTFAYTDYSTKRIGTP